MTLPPMAPQDPFERQEGGDHYSKMSIQPLEYIMANNLHKDSELADWEKAKHYCELRIAQLTRKERT